MIKTKVAFLEGRLLTSRSEQSEKFSKILDWLKKKPALQKSHFCFDHVNRLNFRLILADLFYSFDFNFPFKVFLVIDTNFSRKSFK